VADLTRFARGARGRGCAVLVSGDTGYAGALLHCGALGVHTVSVSR